MWIEYVKERNPNKSTIVKKDKGFAIYYIYEAEEAIYLEDIFVSKEYRRSGIGEEILVDVENKAKELGLRYILGSIDPETEGTTASLLAMIKNKFKTYKISNGLLFLRKDIYGR